MRDGDAISRALGGRGRRYTSGWTFCCPVHKEKHPSCWMRLDGRLICRSAGCSHEAIAAALDAMGFTDDGVAATPISEEDQQALEAQAIHRAQQLWNDHDFQTDNIAYHNEIVANQLRHYRGILLPVPPVIRRLGLNGRIACYQRLDGTVTAVHCRYYSQKGKGWIEGRVSGQHGAVQLAAPTTELGLAEGIETALAAQQLFHIPTWATLSADLLHQADIPPGVRTVHLFADNDAAGLKAMERATRRYLSLGYDIKQWVPPTTGKDWNDYLKGLNDAAT